MENVKLNKQMKDEFSNFDTVRHRKAKPPRDAYLYFPRGVELVEFDEKDLTRTFRKVFEGGVEYNYYEKAMLKELKSEIEKLRFVYSFKKIDLNFDFKESELLRCLQAFAYDISKSVKSLKSHLKWRTENCIGQATFLNRVNDNVMKILNSGLIYIHGRDSRFRPIFIFVPKVYEKIRKKFTYADFEFAFVFLMEYTINNLLLPGQIENVNIIADLRKFSLNSIPDDFRKVLFVLQNNYPCRLYLMYVLNVKNIDGWTVIKKFIDPRVERKVKMIVKENYGDMFAFINRKQVEKKFGGFANDVKGYHFPPVFPSDSYLMENEKKNLILIEENIYENFIKINKELVPSPYLKIEKEKIESNSNIANLALFSPEFCKLDQDNQKLNQIPELTTNNTDKLLNDNVFNENDFTLQKINKLSSTNNIIGEEETIVSNPDILKIVELERNNLNSMNRISNKYLKQSEKILLMSSLHKQTETSPYKSFEFYPKKASNPLINKSTQNSPTKSVSLSHNNDISMLIYNLSPDKNESTEKDSLKLKNSHFIKEEGEGDIQKVCCDIPYKQCLIF